MRRLATIESYGFTNPEAHKQVGWSSLPEAKRRYAFFEQHYQPGMAVLDIGCGNGLFYDWLEENGYKPNYAGVDMSDDFLGQFIERHPEVKEHLFQGTLTGSEWDEAALLEAGPYDVAVLYGVGADFGLGEQTKWSDLKQSIQRAWPVLKEGGKLIIDFWDEKEFVAHKEKSETAKIESIVFSETNPTAWAMGEMVEFLDGFAFEIHKPVVGMDFGVVLHKKDAKKDADPKKEPQEEAALPGTHRVIFDFGDALASDARRTSIEEVDKATDGVAASLGNLATRVSKVSAWGEARLSFLEPIVATFQQAADQLTKQWATVRRTLLGSKDGVTEQLKWEFARALEGDMETLRAAGDDKPRVHVGKVVAAVAFYMESALDEIAAKAKGMTFPADSGLGDALMAAANKLPQDWSEVEQDWMDK